MMSPRINAFLIHLGISLLLFLVLLYVIVYIWYPPPYFSYDGGWQGIQLIIGVDLVLGPLLTLSVFNINKPKSALRRDLIIIGCIQIGALVAGSWIVADQRTRLVMHLNDHFLSMTRTWIEASKVPSEVIDAMKVTHPAMGYLEMPADPAQRQEMVRQSTRGTPLHSYTDLYRPISNTALIDIASRGFDLDETAAAAPELKPRIDEFLAKIDRSSQEVSAVPLYARYGNPSLVIDRQSGEIIDTIRISHDQLLSTVVAKGKKAQQSQ